MVVKPILLILMVLYTSAGQAKDYFGFSFEQDTPDRVCQKVESIFADCEYRGDGHVWVYGNGLLKIAATWLQDARLDFFASQHIRQIEVTTHVLDEDERRRLLTHLQEDYDLPTLTQLNALKLRDERGVYWTITPICNSDNQCRFRVTVARD